MAIILYPSGITESYEPQSHTFTDQEILKIFDDFDDIRTSRLYEIPNTWCVWGENKEADNEEYNKLASDILQEDIFCPVLFIHDTQIDPAWMLTDQIILKGYDQFKNDILRFFDHIAENVILESQKEREEQGKSTNLVFLTAVGPTEDKRVLFEFDPHKQSQEFYGDSSFLTFSHKIREYLKDNYRDDDLFYIYEDKKTVIFTGDNNVEFMINSIINIFNKIEKYEYSQEMTNFFNKWKKFKNKKEKTKKKK